MHLLAGAGLTHLLLVGDVAGLHPGHQGHHVHKHLHMCLHLHAGVVVHLGHAGWVVHLHGGA